MNIKTFSTYSLSLLVLILLLFIPKSAFASYDFAVNGWTAFDQINYPGLYYIKADSINVNFTHTANEINAQNDGTNNFFVACGQYPNYSNQGLTFLIDNTDNGIFLDDNPINGNPYNIGTIPIGQTATISLNCNSLPAKGNLTMSPLVSYAYSTSDILPPLPGAYIFARGNSVDSINSLSISSVPSISILPITVSVNPIMVNTSLIATTSFTDSNTSTHTASWNWGDGSTSSGTVTEPNGSTPGSVTGSHTYSAAGSYIITLSVTDNGGAITGTSPQVVLAVIPSTGLTGSNLTGTNYNGANLSGQNLTGSNLKGTSFNDVTLTGANLSGTNIRNASLQGANLTGADLTNANLKGVDLTNANLTNANLTGANLSGAIITGVIWSNTICPNGTNSNNEGNTCVGQGGGL